MLTKSCLTILVVFMLSCWSALAAGEGEFSEQEQASASIIQRAYRQYKITKHLKENRHHSSQFLEYFFNSYSDGESRFTNLKAEISKVAADLQWFNKPEDVRFPDRCFSVVPFRSEKTWPNAQEETALRGYTSGSYTQINSLLRDYSRFQEEHTNKYETTLKHYGEEAAKKIKTIESIHREIKLINSALSKLDNYPGPLVYRYEYITRDRLHQLGDEFIQSGFLSTSKRINYPFQGWSNFNANMYRDAAMTVLYIIRHRSAKDVSLFSNKSYEEEALIPSGIKFRVSQISDIDDQHRIEFLEEIPTDSP